MTNRSYWYCIVQKSTKKRALLTMKVIAFRTHLFLCLCIYFCIYRKNRQFRVEQRDKNGNVKGQYGYVDKSGKLTVIRYISTAEDGFKSEKMILQ